MSTKETAQDILARIERNRKEQGYCFAVLNLWAGVQAQGIEIESVKAFGFREDLLDQKQRAERNRQWRLSLSDPFVDRLPCGKLRPRFHNYVRHHDGSTTKLEPMLEAVYED
jgi:hypothetical protein